MTMSYTADGPTSVLVISTPVEVTLPDGTVVAASPARPSESAARAHIDVAVENQTSGATLHTVTGGKTFWLTGFGLYAVNSGLATLGRIAFRDSTTVKIPLLLPGAVLGALTPATAGSAFTLLEPVPFTTNVNVAILGGTIAYSACIIGYEE